MHNLHTADLRDLPHRKQALLSYLFLLFGVTPSLKSCQGFLQVSDDFSRRSRSAEQWHDSSRGLEVLENYHELLTIKKGEPETKALNPYLIFCNHYKSSRNERA